METGLAKLESLDNLLLDQPYISGWTPTSLDVQVAQQLAASQSISPELPNLNRWFNHVSTFSDKGISSCNKEFVFISYIEIKGPQFV